MHPESNKLIEADPSKRLTVRLTKAGEFERVLEFHAADDVARVVGRSPNSDVLLSEVGVLPVHCYFEREHDDIWLTAANADAAITVNYQAVVGRRKLGKRCILEVGEARLLVVVKEDDEASPSYGSFGTEVIDVGALRVTPELFETAPIDPQVDFGTFATTAWQRWEREDASSSPTRDSVETAAPVADPRPITAVTRASTPCFDTIRIPRPAVFDVPIADQGEWTTERIQQAGAAATPEPLQPSPCILIEGHDRLAPVPAVPPDHEPTSRHRVISQQPPMSATLSTFGQPAPRVLIARALRDRISARLRMAQVLRALLALRFIASIAPLRQRFAAGLGRDPRVVAVIALYAALSLAALVRQTVRAWPYFVRHPVVERSASPSLSKHTSGWKD
ncbi:MAG TPA: hypothetical protein VFK05_28305 [Polyangiaceae bacterium]|nr:hypothetical protein [Polyangiaceae bacterium]